MNGAEEGEGVVMAIAMLKWEKIVLKILNKTRVHWRVFDLLGWASQAVVNHLTLVLETKRIC